MQSYHSESVARLFQAILLLSDSEECSAFFEDLCTISELQAMAQRLDTAAALEKGQNYQTISREIGVSTATITRVNKCLQYGAGGYRAVLKRLNNTEEPQ